ncbi:hypothetical protein [Lignipirellula cremea]|uniref:Uncharacterized protein n=1 Tax=Lignipirellula cremea TaxID=2528010 RepID=A0A518E1H8_9BACT|nr:hypothetical protein [Lignipirellula cremea]QDU97939.1 hypothetical protein Pla8534_57980 [Lignipirellula cremea]QDU97940.1 hypothetical protein Pla8534_57990 [Lignipirellula cremea]
MNACKKILLSVAILGLLGMVSEAKAQFSSGSSSSWSSSSSSSWGYGPGGSYNNNTSNSSSQQSRWGSGPGGGYSQSSGRSQSNQWGSSLNGNGYNRYNNQQNSGFNNFRRYYP